MFLFLCLNHLCLICVKSKRLLLSLNAAKFSYSSLKSNVMFYYKVYLDWWNRSHFVWPHKIFLPTEIVSKLCRQNRTLNNLLCYLNRQNHWQQCIIVHFRYFMKIKLFVYVYSMLEKNLEFLASTKEDTVYMCILLRICWGLMRLI